MVSMYSTISSSWQIYFKIHYAVYTSFRNSSFTQIYGNIVCVPTIPQSINYFTIFHMARGNDLTKEMHSGQTSFHEIWFKIHFGETSLNQS